MELHTPKEPIFGIACIYSTPGLKGGLVEGHTLSLGCLG